MKTGTAHRANYNNWSYALSVNPFVFSVITPEESNLSMPKFLGRYCSMSHNSLKAFCDRENYFSNPEDFNDLNDSDFNLIAEECWTEENLIRLSDENSIRTYRKNIGDKNLRLELIKSFKLSSSVDLGILCTTTSPINDLLWSYYTNNRGFYLDFDLTVLCSQIDVVPIPMNYVSKLEPIELVSHLMLANLMRINIKKDIWRHEDEWRLIKFSLGRHFETTSISGNLHVGQSRMIGWPKNALKAIYLGYAFLRNFEFAQDGTFKVKDEKNIILCKFMRELVKGEYPIYQICQINFKLEPFKVEFKEIDNSGTFTQSIDYSSKPIYRSL